MTRKLPFFRFWLTSQENLKSEDIAGRVLSETAEKLKMKMSKMSRLFTLEDIFDHNDERHITSFVWLMKTHHQLTYVTYVPRDFIVRKTGTLLIFDNLLVWVLKCTSFLKAAHSITIRIDTRNKERVCCKKSVALRLITDHFARSCYADKDSKNYSHSWIVTVHLDLELN